MERNERYEVNSQGSLVVGIPTTLTPSEKTKMIEKLFSINGWTYTLLDEITSAHFHIELKNENLKMTKKFHLFHGNVRKEDPDRNREEKKIQLGAENDPRQYPDDAIILGFYVYENKEELSDVVVVAWPVEANKNYPANPSLRVNMKTDILPAKNTGYYVDKSTGKNLVAFRPEFIYHYLECYNNIHYGLTVSEDNTTDNESLFKSWFLKQRKDNGEVYSDSTRSQYIGALKAVSNAFPNAIAPFPSVFEINNADAFEKVYSAIKAAPIFEEVNKSRGNGSLSAGLDLYKHFLLTVATKAKPSQNICLMTGYQSGYARNRILFGAPGTGKSFTLNKEKDKLLAEGGEYERVTFHPDYSYANFVGTYKPVPCKDDRGHDAITYSYVPGPFMRIYVKALLNSRTDSPKPFLLVIEEINRANVAAVFGDVFQLLDRDGNEVSEYAIQASEDIKKYLAEKLGGVPEEYTEIRIPDNMFIWATMNSADQGVFPMDTAFKRRWDFTYLGIDDSEDGIKDKTVILGEGQYKRTVEWNKLRKAINDELLTYKVNEDKLMGPYFISKKNLPDDTEIDAKTFTRIFKNKVIMYLFDDAAKQKRLTLFGGCDEKSKTQYSKICNEFDKKGVYIFCDAISNRFIPDNSETEEDAE